jgi:hypothetical protein
LILYSSEIFASATNLKNSLGVKTAVIFFNISLGGLV